MKGELCLWMRKKGFWNKTDRVVPYEKGWKIMKNATCVFGGEYVHMKGKRKGFWLKLIGGTLQKRVEKHEKTQLVFWRGICAHEGEKWWFSTKTDRGGPYEKGWKIMNNATCVFERAYGHMKGKRKACWLKLIGGTLQKEG